MKIKSLFLRLVPFLISMIFGAILFLATYELENNIGLSELILNISASLLSIPLIFIFYEVVSKICNKDIKNNLFKSISFETNSRILNILNGLNNIIGRKNTLEYNDIYDFAKTKKQEVIKKLKAITKPKDDLIKDFVKNTNNLSDLIHKGSALETLENSQIKNILNIVRECGVIYQKLIAINNKSKETANISENFINMNKNIVEWLESYEIDNIILYQS